MKHEIPTELLQLILNYLQTKPFMEVHVLIERIQKESAAVLAKED